MILNNNTTDPNQILPLTYPWAREFYQTGVANNWTPEEVSMQKDVELWRRRLGGLTDAERLLIMRNMGFFSTAESLTANNLVLAIYRQITNAECRQYLLRQGYEEAVHTDTFIYCVDTLGLDPKEVYNAYNDVPSITAKDRFVIDLTRNILNPDFHTQGVENVGRFVMDLVGFYLVMEGIFFYAGFVMMLSLLRQNKMIGVGEQFQFILRDESVHLAFGAQLIRTIRDENQEVWTPKFQERVVKTVIQGVDHEKCYAADCLQAGGILGLAPSAVDGYIEYIADRRLESVGLAPVYHANNPFPWMSEVIDLTKEKNFFETTVTDYQVGTLRWEEEGLESPE